MYHTSSNFKANTVSSPVYCEAIRLRFTFNSISFILILITREKFIYEKYVLFYRFLILIFYLGRYHKLCEHIQYEKMVSLNWKDVWFSIYWKFYLNFLKLFRKYASLSSCVNGKISPFVGGMSASISSWTILDASDSPNILANNVMKFLNAKEFSNPGKIILVPDVSLKIRIYWSIKIRINSVLINTRGTLFLANTHNFTIKLSSCNQLLKRIVLKNKKKSWEADLKYLDPPTQW